MCTACRTRALAGPEPSAVQVMTRIGAVCLITIGIWVVIEVVVGFVHWKHHCFAGTGELLDLSGHQACGCVHWAGQLYPLHNPALSCTPLPLTGRCAQAAARCLPTCWSLSWVASQSPCPPCSGAPQSPDAAAVTLHNLAADLSCRALHSEQPAEHQAHDVCCTVHAEDTVPRSVTLALGAARLAKEGAIVARMSAVEEMAGMSILCSDKTGVPAVRVALLPARGAHAECTCSAIEANLLPVHPQGFVTEEAGVCAGTLTLNHLSVDHATVLNVDPHTQDDVMMCAHLCLSPLICILSAHVFAGCSNCPSLKASGRNAALLAAFWCM